MSTDDFLQSLKRTGTLSGDARLYTVDVTALYQKISWTEGIEAAVYVYSTNFFLAERPSSEHGHIAAP